MNLTPQFLRQYPPWLQLFVLSTTAVFGWFRGWLTAGVLNAAVIVWWHRKEVRKATEESEREA